MALISDQMVRDAVKTIVEIMYGATKPATGRSAARSVIQMDREPRINVVAPECWPAAVDYARELIGAFDAGRDARKALRRGSALKSRD